MNRPNKKQKVEGSTGTYKEEVLFNSDTLSKIISYLPSVDLLNVALTCKRFGVSEDNSEPSLIEETAHVAVQDIAIEEQLAALPYYDGESSLADYHYLQLLREPLTFNQLAGAAEYVGGDKSCVIANRSDGWQSAFSNNILRAGKHYASFTANSQVRVFVFLGVTRPGKAHKNAIDAPLHPGFFRHFTRYMVHGEGNNNVQCCMYNTRCGKCYTSDWEGGIPSFNCWDGMEIISSGDELGMLLDLDEGTLSVYKNGQKLGVMKKGLAGPYCWVVSMGDSDCQVTIKRGTIPPS